MRCDGRSCAQFNSRRVKCGVRQSTSNYTNVSPPESLPPTRFFDARVYADAMMRSLCKVCWDAPAMRLPDGRHSVKCRECAQNWVQPRETRPGVELLL